MTAYRDQPISPAGWRSPRRKSMKTPCRDVHGSTIPRVGTVFEALLRHMSFGATITLASL